MQQTKVARLLYAIEHGHIAILAAMFDLSKRVVILTGGTGHIGRTLIRAYLEQGGHVEIPPETRPRAPLFASRLVIWRVRRRIPSKLADRRRDRGRRRLPFDRRSEWP